MNQTWVGFFLIGFGLFGIIFCKSWARSATAWQKKWWPHWPANESANLLGYLLVGLISVVSGVFVLIRTIVLQGHF